MQAVIIGATGATGKVLLQQLLADGKFSRVRIFVRKPTALSHPKLQEFVIDFERPEQWRAEVRGDVLFSCLGTTIKAAGSRAIQWKIDYDYQFNFAQIARNNGIRHYVLVSSMGANTTAKSFYFRMKGQLDEAVRKLDFPYAIILRPPMLERPNTDRFGEKIGLAIMKGLNAIGLLKNRRPMSVAVLAQAMRQAVEKADHFAVLDSAEIWALQ